MYLKHLNIINYKNIRQVEIDFSEGINCFVGKNGSGKTNLLDSIYYLSFCKSYFNPVDSQIICHDEDFFVIQGIYNRLSVDENIYAGFKKNQKKQFKRNKKEYPKLSEHIGLLPLVIISPTDERLIVESGEQRRKYIDSVISQFDKSYLEYLIRYNHALFQRNTLLKNRKNIRGNIDSQLEVWDNQLVVSGNSIFEKRAKFVEMIIPLFQNYYSYISGENEIVDLKYYSHFQDGDMISLLSESKEKDLALGYTTKGIHRDDLNLILNDYPVRRDGSQGQKKIFLIALKLAQYDFLTAHNNFSPILLFDDIFDKIDTERGNRLIELVSKENFKQIFITDTQKERLNNIISVIGKEFSFYNVNNGVVSEEFFN